MRKKTYWFEVDDKYCDAVWKETRKEFCRYAILWSYFNVNFIIYEDYQKGRRGL